MKEKFKRNTGITLIALVITIIVLLILAGISISFVIGNNGIITQAQNAVTTNQKATAQEQLQMAWLACESEYYEAWSKDTSAKLEDYLTKDKLNAELTATGVVTDLQDEGDGRYFVDYQSYDQGTIYHFYMKNGVVEQPKISDWVTASNYGDYIDYGIDLNDNKDTTDDWKIFYADEKGTYIIASDVLVTEKVPIGTGLKISSSGNIIWDDDFLNSMQGASSIGSDVKEIFKASFTNNNSLGDKKAVAMVDTNRWKSFVTDEIASKGGMAIGSPTLEMWVASWNKKSALDSYSYPFLYTQLGGDGYYIGNYVDDRGGIPGSLNEPGYGDGTSPQFPSSCLYMGETTACYDDLYFLSASNYLLASESVNANSDRYVLYVDFSLNNSGDNSPFRPVVYIPASISGGKQENGIWKLGSDVHIDGSN